MKTQHFHAKLLCQKPMLRQFKWGVQTGLSQGMDFCHWLFLFMKNLFWVKETLINSWFNVPIESELVDSKSGGFSYFH